VNIGIPLGQFFSIFQAELYAILYCVNHPLLPGIRRIRIGIPGSSANIRRGILRYSPEYFRNDYFCPLVTSIDYSYVNSRLVLPIFLGFLDTPILGNEEADQLAKLGSSMNFIGLELAPPLSSGWPHESIKILTLLEHKKYWYILESCQQAKLYLKTPFAADKLKHSNKNMLHFLVIAYLINKHLHSLGLSHSSLCDRCEFDIGSMYHILCLSPTLSQIGHSWLSLSEYKKLCPKASISFMVSTNLK
jgi:hypothetical protein